MAYNSFIDAKRNHFVISNRNEIFYRDMNTGKWAERILDKSDNMIYYRNSDKLIIKRYFDKNNNLIYSEENGYPVVNNMYNSFFSNIKLRCLKILLSIKIFYLQTRILVK